MNNAIKCGQVFKSEEEMRRAIMPEGHKVVVVAVGGEIKVFSDPMPADSSIRRNKIDMRLAGARVTHSGGEAYVYP
ncbi:MAG: hypothetical protein NTY33_00140 [Candidatus Moranbacteria bacterium]|nr:hypothetical protein [Candidatus Moranbacteria bacterium]